MTTRIIKPDQVALLHKPIVWPDGRVELCFCLGLLFPFTDPQAVGTEQALWALTGAALPDGILDACDPKPTAEVLASAAAFSARAVEHLQVRLNFGDIDKRLDVTGGRIWESGFLGMLKPGPAQPFTALPLGWDRTFGGPGFAENPLGAGHKPQAGDALPSLTYPGDSLSDVLGRMRPAGFGAIAIDWEPRRRRRGKPLRGKPPEDQPLGALPPDYQPELFMIAPEDQWLPAYLQGDERFTVENMHPLQPVQQGQLPDMRLRCFVRYVDGTFSEVKLAIDTVWLVPEVEQGIVLTHGLTPIAAPEFRDIDAILCAFERGSEAKRPVIHYLDALERRLDPDTGAEAQLQQADLRPPGWVPPDATRGIPPMRTRKLHKRPVPKAAAAKLAAQASLLAAIRPAPAAPPLPPDPEAAAITSEVKAISSARPKRPADITRQQKHAKKLGALVRAQVARKQAAAEAKAREALSRMGLDYATVAARGAKKAASDPAAMMKHFDAEITRMARSATDPTVRAALSNIGLAGHIPKMTAATKQLDAARKKQMALLGHLMKAPSEGEDLTGADFSGQDLSGRDFSHANLTGATFAGAKLIGANLGGAKLDGTNLTATDLTEATLSSAKGEGADFSGAILTRANFLKSHLLAPVFVGALFEETVVHASDWQQADLTGAQITKLLFSTCTLPGLRLDGAKGTKLILLGGAAVGLTAIEAELPGLTTANAADLSGADFTGAILIGSNFHTAKLAGAAFVEADLADANMAEAQLQGANLTRMRARGAAFMGADLTGACLDGADLLDANFGKAILTDASARGANLHAVEASQAVTDGLDTEGANLGRSRLG
jgi:uncharacterized protein YjbI with pentapeptide repeats